MSVNEGMRFRTFAAVALVVVSSSSDAEAKCAMPGVRFEPPDGTLPSSPVVRLFVPPHQIGGPLGVHGIDAAGNTVAPTVVSESTSDAFTSYRLSFNALKKGAFTVRFTGKYGGPRDATYTIDPKWVRPAFAAPKLTLTRVQTSWTCSHQLTRNVTFPSVAPAYRLTFAPTKPALAASKSSLVLPADVRTLFGAYSPTGASDLALGNVNCMGTTYEWKGGQWVRITALFPDGSEGEVTPGIFIDPP